MNNLLRIMSDTGLCNRCGTCVGLSEGKIIFSDREGKYLPEILQEPDPSLAELLYYVCTGKGFDFPSCRQKLFGNEGNFHLYTGNYRQLYIAYSNDPEIRLRSASGGLLSHILIWLLEKGMIDGAVVLGMSKEKSWQSQPFIATSREEILQAAQSKYTISSVNEILPEIARFGGNLAYTGLPGQVQSVRLLQQMRHPSVKNIRFVLGPFYGNTLHFSSVISLLKSYKIQDYRRIKKLDFRYGEWPGSMRIELDDGRVITLKKFHANYLIPFHMCKSSLFCTDFTNEFTDISGGDAWAPEYEERGKGFSMLVVRSRQGEEIIRNMAEEKAITLLHVSLEEAIRMHSHGYDFKKRGAFIRMHFRKLAGRQVPDYGYRSLRFPLIRWLMEIIIDFLFLMLSTRFARWVSEQIPPETIGKMFEKARKIWKNSTQKIKRKNLAKFI